MRILISTFQVEASALYKIGLATGLSFLVVWLIVTAIIFNSEGKLGYLGLAPFILPFAQAGTFILYRSDRQKQKIGAIILALMAISVALFYLHVPVDAYSINLLIFLVVAFASGLLHAFFDLFKHEGVSLTQK